jgi:tetratricopeptide (TPR) repeat protein
MGARRFTQAFLCALVLVAQPAEAAPPPPLAESLQGSAKRSYDAAKLLFTDKDFAGASIKFREAFDESGDPRLLWNIAASEKNLRHYERAVGYIRRYLVDAAALATDEQRASAEQALAALEGFLGEVAVTIDPEAARLLVDGDARVEQGASRVLRIDQGKRTIRAELEGFAPFEGALEIVGGRRFPLPIVLTPIPKPAAKPEPGPSAPSAPEIPPSAPLASSSLATTAEEGEAFTFLDVHWGWWAAGAAVLTTAITVTALAVASDDAAPPPIVPGTIGSVRLPLGVW